ncbi:MAG: hypothetical protein ACD_79C00238G0005 [uncultured bacterium]|nr:MAG: hypothetical protein ACD_79C00238G0005 [uncultured bacterium]
MIKLENINKIFSQTKLQGLRLKNNSVNALRNINLEIEPCSIFGILGPNGAGKSTLLKLIYGALSPTSGSIIINNVAIEKNKSVLSTIGICTENEKGFYNKLTGRENLEFYGSFYGLTKLFITNRISELESFFHLENNLNSYYQYYSSGNKKRLALMRALLHNPSILLLDEITDNLDPLFRENLMFYLFDLCKKEKRTILFASQRIEEICSICSRVIFLKKGNLIQDLVLSEQCKKDLNQIYKNNMEFNK